MTLQNLRIQIDAIDAKLLSLLAERVSLSVQVRAFKTQAHDPEREAEVQKLWQERGASLGLDSHSVQKLTDDILALSRSAQPS